MLLILKVPANGTQAFYTAARSFFDAKVTKYDYSAEECHHIYCKNSSRCELPSNSLANALLNMDAVELMSFYLLVSKFMTHDTAPQYYISSKDEDLFKRVVTNGLPDCDDYRSAGCIILNESVVKTNREIHKLCRDAVYSTRVKTMQPFLFGCVQAMWLCMTEQKLLLEHARWLMLN